MKIFTNILLCSLAVSMPSPMGAQETTPVGTVTVPFTLLKSNHIVIKVKVNGKGPYRVIFDTGAPINLLNNKVAREAGLLGKKEKPGFFNLFGSMGQVTVKSLEVGDLKVRNTTAMIMDHPTVEMISKVLGPVEGIIGFPFFARYRMAIDYQAKKLTFEPTKFVPPDVLQSIMTTVMALSQDKPPVPKVLAPAAQWGLVVVKAKGDEQPGVNVKQVLSSSAAAEAGIEPGDRLLTMDSRWTDSVEDVFFAAGSIKPGQPVSVVLSRQGKQKELIVTPRAGL